MKSKSIMSFSGIICRYTEFMVHIGYFLWYFYNLNPFFFLFQYDIPTAVHPSVPVPNYGPPNIPPAAFNIASHLNTELYHGDPSALNQVNQSKKVGVHSFC